MMVKLLKINKKEKYLYLNPLEGALIMYESLAKFPQKP